MLTSIKTPTYLPWECRAPDTQYRDLLRRILHGGELAPTIHGEDALKIIGHQMRFPMANGFPLITERDLASASSRTGRPSPFHQAIGEICAFLNGAQTQADLESFGCFWWDRWVTAERCAEFGLPPGDLGPGSYGAAWRRFPTGGKPFDQVAALLRGIRERPESRYHEITPWIPHLALGDERSPRRVAVPPCHGWVHVHPNPRTREMTLVARQRSADVPVGLVFNLIHYGALLLMLAQTAGYAPRELVYWIDDAHIYESQIDAASEMLETEPQRLPTVAMDPSVDDLFAFRHRHFTVTDYTPQLGPRRIPTPL
jgi:thymidylate synthase